MPSIEGISGLAGSSLQHPDETNSETGKARSRLFKESATNKTLKKTSLVPSVVFTKSTSLVLSVVFMKSTSLVLSVVFMKPTSLVLSVVFTELKIPIPLGLLSKTLFSNTSFSNELGILEPDTKGLPATVET